MRVQTDVVLLSCHLWSIRGRPRENFCVKLFCRCDAVESFVIGVSIEVTFSVCVSEQTLGVIVSEHHCVFGRSAVALCWKDNCLAGQKLIKVCVQVQLTSFYSLPRKIVFLFAFYILIICLDSQKTHVLSINIKTYSNCFIYLAV